MNNVIEVEALTKEQISNTYRYRSSSSLYGEDYDYFKDNYTFKKTVTLTIWTTQKEKEWIYPKGWFWGLFGHKEEREIEKLKVYKISDSCHDSFICSYSSQYERSLQKFKEKAEDFDPFKDLQEILDIATNQAFKDLNILGAEKHLKEAYNKEEYLKLKPYQQEILSYLSTNTNEHT